MLLVAAALVGLASLAALVGSVYVRIPSIGPLPGLYEPSWYLTKVAAAVGRTGRYPASMSAPPAGRDPGWLACVQQTRASVQERLAELRRYGAVDVLVRPDAECRGADLVPVRRVGVQPRLPDRRVRHIPASVLRTYRLVNGG